MKEVLINFNRGNHSLKASQVLFSSIAVANETLT